LSGFFNDYEKLAVEAMVAQGADITLNPVNPDLLARSANRLQIAGKDSPLTTDTDVTRRGLAADRPRPSAPSRHFGD
jgi:hypothetical protein